VILKDGVCCQIAEPEKEPGRKEEDRAEVKKADNTTKVRGIMDDDDDDDDEVRQPPTTLSLERSSKIHDLHSYCFVCSFV